MTTSPFVSPITPQPSAGTPRNWGSRSISSGRSATCRLAYLSRGSAKIELLAGAGPAPQERFAQLDKSFGVERLHHFCLAVDDLDAQ